MNGWLDRPDGLPQLLRPWDVFDMDRAAEREPLLVGRGSLLLEDFCRHTAWIGTPSNH